MKTKINVNCNELTLLIFYVAILLLPLLLCFKWILFDKCFMPYSIFIIAIFICLVVFVGPKIFNKSKTLSFFDLKNTSKLDKLPLIFLSLFLCWAIVSVFFAENVSFALFDCYSGRGEGLLMYFCYAIIIFCGGCFKRDSCLFLLKIFIYGSLFVCFLSLLDFFVIDLKFPKINKNGLYWLCGPFSNPNHFGYYLAMVTTCCGFLSLFEKKIWKKSFLVICFAFLSGILVFNDTLGSILAVWIILIIGWIFVLFKDRRLWKNYLIIFTIFLTMFLFVGSLMENFSVVSIFNEFKNLYNQFFVLIKKYILKIDIAKLDNIENIESYGTYRWGLWIECFKNMSEKPLWGIGINCQDVHNPLLDVNRPHNEILQWGSTMGIPAMIFYILAFLFLIVNFCKKIKQVDSVTFVSVMVVCVYLISSLFGVSLPYTWVYFAVFIGISFSSVARTNEKK